MLYICSSDTAADSLPLPSGSGSVVEMSVEEAK